jgi:hypothetical protein
MGITHNLDLHGVRHHEVEVMVEDFILMNQDRVPLKIICGNSQRMIDFANKGIDNVGCKTVAMDQYGIIVIREI